MKEGIDCQFIDENVKRVNPGILSSSLLFLFIIIFLEWLKAYISKSLRNPTKTASQLTSYKNISLMGQVGGK